LNEWRTEVEAFGEELDGILLYHEGD